jgi:hypothetical protein
MQKGVAHANYDTDCWEILLDDSTTGWKQTHWAARAAFDQVRRYYLEQGVSLKFETITKVGSIKG